MWKLADLNPQETYFLRLCEHEDGRRYTLLVTKNESEGGSIGLETEQVPFELLCKCDFEAIALIVRLKSGGGVGIDARGIWMTIEEADALLRAKGNFSKVCWVNGRIPRFTSKKA